MFGPVPALSTSVLEVKETIDAILAATAAKEKRNLRPRAKLLPFQEMIAYWLREIGLIEAFHVKRFQPARRYTVQSFYKPNFA